MMILAKNYYFSPSTQRNICWITSMWFPFEREFLCEAFLIHREDSHWNNKSPVGTQFCNTTMVKPVSSRKKWKLLKYFWQFKRDLGTYPKCYNSPSYREGKPILDFKYSNEFCFCEWSIFFNSSKILLILQISLIPRPCKQVFDS